MENSLMQLPTYDPGHLIDKLIDHLQLKNDAALARILEVAPPVISKLRHFRIPVGASMLIRMHEESGLSINDLRRLMGDTRRYFGVDDAPRARQHKPLTAYLSKDQTAKKAA